MAEQRIGNFVLQGTIGAGAFATVWRARDELLDVPVAIKVLADNWARTPDIRRRFIEEARILRRLDDDRVVRVHVVDELPDGRPYLVMALADGGTLADRMRDDAGRGRAFPVVQAARIVEDLCDSLAVVHDFDIVHRDLKPSNVLFRSRPRATGGAFPGEQLMLGDFGLAKNLVVASGFTLAAGTPAYMAPEQSRATAELDHRADLYSVGAILFELLAGRPPFDSSTLSGVGRRDVSAVAPSLTRLCPDVPPALVAEVERALDERPERRHPSALALAEAVRAAIDPSAGAVASPATVVVLEAPAAPAPPVLLPGVRGRVAELVDMVLHQAPVDGVAEVRSRLSRPCRAVALAADGSSHPSALDGLPGPLELEVVRPADDRTAEAVGESDAVVVALTADPEAARARAGAAIAAARAAAAGPVAVLGLAPASALDELRADSTLRRDLSALLADDDAEGLIDELALVTRRADLVRASAGLVMLNQALDRDPSPASSAAWELIGEQLEVLQLQVPALDELAVLRDLVSGRVAMSPGLQAGLRRLLLGADTPARLGLDADASVAEQADALEALLGRWRRLLNEGRIPFAARGAAEAVIRCLDRLWEALG